MKSILYCLVLLFVVTTTMAQTQKHVEVFEGKGQMKRGLKVLDLSNKNLDRLPARTFDSNVEILILDNNNLTELPNNIANLTNLRVLSVRNNNLVELNQLIEMCTKLEELYLSGNPKLSDLPSLSELKRLKIIDVTDTGIHDLPVSAWLLDDLYYFKYTVFNK
ncbi:MAG: hypothetical protein Q8862_01425 [Bacteroidota bacterium]|nr:hypothetical protein [Bacteroidota bacterium]MDP4206507.1 hypothetical protein [Bacteroidota bacterium]